MLGKSRLDVVMHMVMTQLVGERRHGDCPAALKICFHTENYVTSVWYPLGICAVRVRTTGEHPWSPLGDVVKLRVPSNPSHAVSTPFNPFTTTVDSHAWLLAMADASPALLCVYVMYA